MRHLPFLVVAALGLTSEVAAADAVLAPGEPLTRATLERLVGDGLGEESAHETDGAELELKVEGPRLPLPNRSSQPTSLALADLSWDRRTGRWTATLTASLPTGESSAIPTWGRAEVMVEVMVPSRPIARGERLDAQDLEPRLVSAGTLADDTVRSGAALVASEALRSLPRGRPLRERDLAPPRLVRRGETVTMIYERGGLTLATLGEALDDAGTGQPVRVKNADSGEIRRGTAIASRRVLLGLPQGAYP